jgi:hypothetical protein
VDILWTGAHVLEHRCYNYRMIVKKYILWRSTLEVPRHILLFFALFFSTSLVHAAELGFERTLQVGSVGTDVQKLQIILNSDPETRISESGPGSPGLETSYFGNLTRMAVVRFQEKNADTILKPNGLAYGTGIVGPATRSVLLSIQNSPDVSVGAGINDTRNSTRISPTSTNYSAHSTTTENPNTKNLDIFLANVERVSKSKGVAQKEIDRIKKQIVIDTATTTDLMDTFEKIARQSVAKAPDPVQTLVDDVVKQIKLSFFPKKVRAQTTGVPFGAGVLFPFYCTCSGNWLLTLQPLPPTFPVLLTYYQGTQLFMGYNAPFTLWLLGEYTPGAGQCSIYIGVGCSTISSEGQITSFLGSSTP